jgi:hypothetical protein
MLVRQDKMKTIRLRKGCEDKGLGPLSRENSGIKSHYRDCNHRWCLSLGSLLHCQNGALRAGYTAKKPLSSLKPQVVPGFRLTITPSERADSPGQSTNSTIASVIPCGVSVKAHYHLSRSASPWQVDEFSFDVALAGSADSPLF